MVKLNDVYGAAARGCGGDRAWLWYRHGKGKIPGDAIAISDSP